MKRALPILTVLALGFVGCSGDAELSKDQDKQLRNNFSRTLTPEEVARMGGGQQQSEATSGAPVPDKKKG